jgi:hypothetical protein
VTVAEEEDLKFMKILDDIRAAISEVPTGAGAGLLVMAMIEIANKERWSSARLLAWFVQALAALEHRFNLTIEDEGEGQTLQ